MASKAAAKYNLSGGLGGHFTVVMTEEQKEHFAK
jgi:hypothetical protein